MSLRRCLSLPLAALVVAASGAVAWSASTQTVAAWTLAPHHLAAGHRSVCGSVAARQARCLSHVAVDATGGPLATTSPASGSYGPTDLQSAYALTGTSSGSGRTVAIVDAYDNPNAAGDLAAYRSRYGLPACTTANGCFRKVNQLGATGPLPSPSTGWGQEIDLDIEMVSAVCPSCSIVLVEASSANLSDLATGVNTAASLGAAAISNSYGGSEYPAEVTDQTSYNHPGSLVTVSSGDSGYGVQFPAASRYVLAVGGTSLTRTGATSRGWSETAWSGAGSGCSAYIAKPTLQVDPGCSRRTVADVSAVADPATGVAVYDSYGSSNGADWYVFGGTSVAAPIVAGIGARAGATSASAFSPYTHTGGLNDVVTGSNGSCSGSYLCTALPGFDGPTGLGTPVGTTAFGSGTAPTPTPTPAPRQLMVNGGFESASFAPWTTVGGAPTPVVTGARAHSGTHSTLLGTAGATGTEPSGDSSVVQSVSIPASASTATLSFWYYGGTTDTVTYDWQEAQIRSSSGAILAQVMKTASNARAWALVTFDMAAYRGQTVQLYFNVHQDGYGDLTSMYLDDVGLATG